MSYLDVPRLHFAGVFVAQPSTVNNTPENYNPVVLAPDPGWNPDGTGQWQFKNCSVQAVVYSDGTVCDSVAHDPVIGSPIQGTNQPKTAKLVDLDPEQQMVSEIWGFQVQLGISTGPDSFVGDYEVAAFTDIWFRATAGGEAGDAPMGAAYQSVLRSIKWSDILYSRFLKELMQASPERLSIKFNLDGINMDSSSPDFTQGRIVGTIGPAGAGEPSHMIAGRLLRSAPGTDPNIQPMTLQGTPESSPMFFAPCKVEPARKRVMVDLGNSISTTTPGGPPNPNLETLALAILPSDASPILLGQIKYQTDDWYKKMAGVQEFPVTDEQLALLETNRLGVVQISSSGEISAPFLQENSLGAFIRADNFVFRLNPDETAQVELIATVFGKPAANQLITLKFDAESVNAMQSPPNPASIPIGQPQTALDFPASVTTDQDGRASFTLSASDPGNPRQFIDGQVYGVRYVWGAEEPPDYNHDPTSFISVLVFDSYPYTDSPTWKDVQPILSQYAKLYPFMSNNVVNLADYSAVKQNLASIKHVLTLPRTNPGYMQVTRDLSRDKLKLILRWIELGAPE